MEPRGEPAMSSESGTAGTPRFGVPQGDPGGATLVVPLENMREMSNELHAMADDLERNVVARLRETRIEPAGADAVSEMVAYRFNQQIHDPYTGGLAAAKAAVANLRAGAEGMTQKASAYEAQEEATAAGLRADLRA